MSDAAAIAASPLPRGHRLVLSLRPQDESRVFYLLPALDWDGAFSFALTTSMLFMLQMGTYGAVLFSLLTLVWVIARRSLLGDILRQRWFLLIFPAFALLSTLWSEAPFETLKHSCEYAWTILAALLLAASPNQRSVLLGIFAAFAIYVSVSLAVGNVVDVGTTGVSALSGLSESKNEQADIAATGFVLSSSVLLIGLRMGSLSVCAAAAAAGSLELYAAWAAHSAGALMGVAIAMALLGLLLAMCLGSRAVRATGISIVFSAAALLAVAPASFKGAAQELLAELFDKDTTLTGRTYLWERANELVAEHPFLGRGFAAFWQQGNLDAEGLWQFAHITTREGFNFHSTMYDALVGLGWIGFAIFACTLAAGLAKLAAGYVRKPTLLSCFWLSMASYMLVRIPIESIGLSEFYFSTVLLFALLGWALVPGDRAGCARIGRAEFVTPARELTGTAGLPPAWK